LSDEAALRGRRKQDTHILANTRLRQIYKEFEFTQRPQCEPGGHKHGVILGEQRDIGEFTNIEWSNVIFLIATFCPVGRWTAEQTTPSRFSGQ
jgi:hypothetical protein